MKSDTMWHINVMVCKIRYDLTGETTLCRGTRCWATTSKLDNGTIPWSTIVNINHMHLWQLVAPQSRTPLIPGGRETSDTTSVLMWLLARQALLEFPWGQHPHENLTRADLLLSPRWHGCGSGKVYCKGPIWIGPPPSE